MEHRWWSRPMSGGANFGGGSLQGKLLHASLGVWGMPPGKF